MTWTSLPEGGVQPDVPLPERLDKATIAAATLIGHGTYDGVDYKFNIPGADITAAELAGPFSSRVTQSCPLLCERSTAV